MVINFGKFAGYDLRDIPDDNYIGWLYCEASIKNRMLREAVEEEYRRRIAKRVAPSAAMLKIEFGQLDLARQVFESGFKSLLKAKHPDTGGITSEMQALNSLRDALRPQFAVLGDGR